MTEQFPVLQPELSEKLPARMLFLPYVKYVHELHANEFLSNYDTDLRSITEEDLQQLLTGKDLVLSTIEFNSDVVHEGPILGSPNFKMFWSGAWGNIEPENGTKSAIYSPAKIVDVHFSDKPHDGGLIYLCADLPPVAVHAADIEYVTKLTGVDESDFRIIDLVEANFGAEAVEYISDETCSKIMNAMQATSRYLI